MKRSTRRKLIESLVVMASLIYPTLLCADEGQNPSQANRKEVSERFRRLRAELTNDLNNRLITSDQYSAEIAKLDQLKVQEHADASANQGQLTQDQRSMYNDALSQIQRDIDQMLEATALQPPPSTLPANPMPLPADWDRSTHKGDQGDIYERFRRLWLELTNDLNNHLITTDQYHEEMARLDQLKIQEHVDASQKTLEGQKSMYNDSLNQIQSDIDQMLEANASPPPSQ